MNQLKDAEKRASQLVNDARKGRVERMKEAKSEAEQVIAAYRAEMEAEYQKEVSKNNASSGSTGSELDTATNKDIAKLGDEFSRKKGTVASMLCQQVCDVHVKAPKAREY